MKKNLSKHSISLVINTKNEEENIKKCIVSAKNIVNEIIVVDMHSSDNTVRYAKELGAKVFFVKDYGYVEPARNYAIQKATSDWILILDADELISNSLAEKIISIVNKNEYDVIKIPNKTIIFGKWMKHTGWWPVSHIRLFKKKQIIWSNKIHSQPIIKGRVFELPFEEKYSIIHNNFKSIDHLLSKIIKYTKYGSEKKVEILFNNYLKEFNERFIENKGYLDNNHGYFLSRFMEIYKFLELARYWEKSGYTSILNMQSIKSYQDNNDLQKEKIARHQLELRFKNEIRNNLIEINNLKNTINIIKSSKFFKLWQKYCSLRDNFLNKYDKNKSKK